jgi:hypothetical protein
MVGAANLHYLGVGYTLFIPCAATALVKNGIACIARPRPNQIIGGNAPDKPGLVVIAAMIGQKNVVTLASSFSQPPEVGTNTGLLAYFVQLVPSLDVA